jgi:hypothetical protein
MGPERRTEIKQLKARLEKLEAQEHAERVSKCDHEWREDSDHIGSYRICYKCKAHNSYNHHEGCWNNESN